MGTTHRASLPLPTRVPAVPSTTTSNHGLYRLPRARCPEQNTVPQTTAPDTGAALIAAVLLPLLAPTALELKAASDEAIAFSYQEAEAFRKTALATAGNHHDRWLTSLVDTVASHPNVRLAVEATKHLLAIHDDVSSLNFV